MSNPATLRQRLRVSPRYHLGRTLGGLRMGATDPSFRMAGRALAFAMRTAEGPVTVEVGHKPGSLDIRLWGPGSGWIEPRLAGLVGLDDTPEDFQPTHPVVRDLWQRFHGTRLPRKPRIFDRVVQVVALQLIKSSEGYRAWKRIVWEFGEPAPGPQGLTLPPAPEVLADQSDAAFVAHGLPHKQARTLIRVSEAAQQLETAAEQGVPYLTEAMLSIRGVGPWTVGYVCGTAMGDADAVLPYDYNLPKAVGSVLAGERGADDDRMFELLEPFRGHRFRIVKLVWQSGVKKRQGPRRPNRPIEPFRRRR